MDPGPFPAPAIRPATTGWTWSSRPRYLDGKGALQDDRRRRCCRPLDSFTSSASSFRYCLDASGALPTRLFPELGTSCTVGVGDCRRTGAMVCLGNGSGTICSATPGPPTAGVCDGHDNDCDGQIDNGNPGGGGTCSTGQLGVCAAGTQQCQGGTLVCVRNIGPSPETAFTTTATGTWTKAPGVGVARPAGSACAPRAPVSA